jgi:SAM-dependent methyltransferase
VSEEEMRVERERLVAEMSARYGVGARFAEAYLEYWLQPGGRQAGRRFESLEQILALPPPDSTWFDYALSTNARGRELASLILKQPDAPAAPRRFLDIGSGFGGLVAAFAERGLEVRGIEPDIVRVRLSEANCADQGLADVIVADDILDERLVATLGTFDVIAMIDVIEHVLDMPAALRHATALLRPGGVLLLEIPNRDSLRFVASDGHFGAFGITLLERADAEAYHQTLFGYPYDVGDYYALSEYERHLEAAGCDVRQLASPLHPPAPLARVPELVTSVQQALERYESAVAPTLPSDIHATLRARLVTYMSGLTAELAGNGTDEAFETRYLTDFWTLFAKKRDG